MILTGGTKLIKPDRRESVIKENSPVKGSHKNKVKSGRGVRVQANFEGFVVVRVNAKTRDETVNHQINILVHVGLSP